MKSSWHTALALLFVSPAIACGGTVRTASTGVPVDGGSPTSVPGSDAGAGSSFDAAPTEDASPAIDVAPTPPGPGLLLFAGWGEAPLNDTWTWDGSAWSELSIAGPSVRSDQSMIGLGPNSVLLFGGQGLGPFLGDTWQWNGTAWTQLNVTGPSAREGAGMAMLDGKVILYGGSGTAGGLLSDTWAWDGTHWTQLFPAGPTPGGRYAHSMVTLGSKVVLFGNVGGPTDTWTFDGTAWKQAATAGPTGEPGGLFESRGFQGMATLGDKVVLFGGEQDANHILNDTWEWDGAKWTQRAVASPPPARFHPAMGTFDGKVVLFGGSGAPGGFLDDTWTWDGTSWTEVSASGGPSPRYGYVFATH